MRGQVATCPFFVTFISFFPYTAMIHHYLKTVFFLFIVFQAKTQDGKYAYLYPFEDYSKCTTGFLDGSSWPRDTIYPAKFDFVSQIGDVSNWDNHRTNFIYHWIVSENGKYGCLSQENEWFLDCVYDSLGFDWYFNQFIVKKSGKIGTLNTQKKTVFPFEFEEIYTESPLPIGYYLYGEGGWGIISELYGRKNGLLGVYDKNARAIIAPEFDTIRSYFYNVSGERNDTLYKRFYRVKKDNRFGLYDGAGKLLIPVKYNQLQILFDNQITRNTILFAAYDSLGQQCIVDEYGKQLTPFSKFGYEVAITVGTKQEFQTPKFVSETDIDACQQRLTNLLTGKVSEWYPEIVLLGDWCWVKSGDRWIILDSNFNKSFTQKNTGDRLYCFDAEHELKPVEEVEYITYQRNNRSNNEYDYTIPPIFLIQRKNLKEGESQMRYGLVNVASGKQFPVKYSQVIRLKADTDYYYWCFYDVKDTATQQSEVSIDIYNGNCKLFSSIRVNWSKEELLNPTRSYYNYNSGAMFPIVRTPLPDGKYTIHGVDGWQPKSHEFKDVISGIYKVNSSTGNIHFIDTSGLHYFTDFNGKPLLEGKHFETKKYFYSSAKWILDMKYESSIDFINEKLEILLDSCQEYYNLDYPKIKDEAANHEYVLFANRNGFIYMIYNDSVKKMDARMFSELKGMNQIANRIYVDDSGKKISDEQVDLYFKSKNTKIGDIWLRLENGELFVENNQHALIQEIPDVYNYKYAFNDAILIINKDKKEGLINVNSGNWTLKPMYEHLYYMGRRYPNMIFVQDKQFHDTCWFVADHAGKPLTKPIFDKPFVFENGENWGYALSNGKYGAINRQLEWATEPLYLDANTVAGVTIMKGTDHNAIVNEYTGKSFRTTKDSVVLINDKYLFLFKDSVQITDYNGVELLPPTKISYAINSLDLGKFFYEPDGYETLPYASGDHIFTPVTNKFLVHMNNQLIIDNARYQAIPILEEDEWLRYSYSTNEKRCHRTSTFLNNNAYSEKLEGECFEHIGDQSYTYWKTTFRTYWIRNNSLVQIKNLSDLFKEGSDYDSLLDKLIAEQIQANQTFGVACANVPAAVVEFKRNFYLNGHNLGFIYYDVNDNYYVEIDLNVLKSVLKPELKQ